MAKLLFVCAGNSCRSPMAMLIANKHFQGRHQCDSASGGDKVGKSVSSKAVSTIDIMKGINGTLRNYKPKALSDELVKWADYIFFLGEDLLNKAQGLYFGQPSLMHKMKLYDPIGKNVPDPFDGDFFPADWKGKITPKTMGAYQRVANLMERELTPNLAQSQPLENSK